MMDKLIFITSSKINNNRAGDNKYSAQWFYAVSAISETYAVIINSNISFFFFIGLLLLFPLAIIFPFMWKGIFNLRNIYHLVISSKNFKPNIVVIDHFRVAWSAFLLKLINRKVKIVHISHNLESSVALSAVSSKSIVFRLFYLFDGIRIKFWERLFFSFADATSFITKEDCLSAEKSNLVSNMNCQETLPYIITGEGPPTGQFTPTTHCINLLILGSFFWNLKQRNLLDFLNAAQQYDLCSTPIKVIIAGSMSDAFHNKILTNYRFVEVIKGFDNLENLSGLANFAVAPDSAGGGFKLKILDYLKLGLPIFALNGAVNGVYYSECPLYLSENYTEMWKMILSTKPNVTDLSNAKALGITYLKKYHSKDVFVSKVFHFISPLLKDKV